ncbi:alanine--tRNA ligase [Pantoea sp. Aalb]|uniref:alanine--tRNA ligase n=1 Tax=Pantoea sp. Aalb TaxID=2576762 RepID=UPI001325423D|nr:alanine--tRNA ligase [Pantoea sp. Aalb]MXP67770.1 alanine--tRNA ligase [Pantoea sp. Aalb]
MIQTTSEIRQKFLNFFYTKGHLVVASSSLIPNNDQSLLFTNAGMVQFKEVFLGQERRNYKRATTAQRCIRTGGKHNDLEKVGYTTRHHTFFEMLGNFSFGDYFKKEAISYAWELLTSERWFNLPKERLWCTVYETDDESFKIWADYIGIPYERIIRIGNNNGNIYSSDNFWRMGDTGPCGPCTEIFYDREFDIDDSSPNIFQKDSDRYIEIWNIVFMQFNLQANGTIKPLPIKSVDTGMGLERITAVLQHVNSTYEIDLFVNLIKSIIKVIDVDNSTNKSLSVIADHIRCCSFLIADGVIPSNENRGYVLRRVIRRAVRHGRLLGTKEVFFYKLVAPLIYVMDSVGEYLKPQQVYIENILKKEEEQFDKTLERGLALLDEELANLKGNTLSGETIFRLYDTFGFPVDLTADVCRERNFKIDETGFREVMNRQRKRAREASCFNNPLVINISSVFKGYNCLSLHTTVQLLLINGQQVEKITVGQEATVFLVETPFYGASGGQLGDTGIFTNKNIEFNVIDTKKYGKAIGHIGIVKIGQLCLGDHLYVHVNKIRRKRISLNHSATHLLHSALRQVLGSHVVQKGSSINDKYLRFDFLHFHAMNPQEIRKVEDIVNLQIRRNLTVTSEIMDLSTAKKKGAMALFSEKYDQHVRVLKIGDFSIELCGGTHVRRTGDIGIFRIRSETSTSVDVRRIEAVTGEYALEEIHAQSQQLQEIAHLIKANRNNINKKTYELVNYIRLLEKELQLLREQRIKQEIKLLIKKTITVQNTKLLVSEFINVDLKTLRLLIDDLKNKFGSVIIVLATITKNKVLLIASVTQDLIDRINACELITSLAVQVDGKGGGRSDMAQASGTNTQALASALASVKEWVNTRL